MWGGISAIIAAFFSAWVASHLCTATDRGGGMLHGIALWGLTWAVSLWIAAMAVGGVVGTATSAASTAAGAAGDALSSLSASAVTDEALQQANAWLRENGKPGVTRQQMEASLQAIAANAAQRVREGESPAAALQQDAIVSSLARNTSLSADDAEQLATQLRGQLERAVSGASAQAPAVAEAATSGASKGAWGAFLAALLTLVASAAGGAAGVPARARREAAETAARAGHLRASTREGGGAVTPDDGAARRHGERARSAGGPLDRPRVIWPLSRRGVRRHASAARSAAATPPRPRPPPSRPDPERDGVRGRIRQRIPISGYRAMIARSRSASELSGGPSG